MTSPLAERRTAFVTYLHRLHRGLESDEPWRLAEARRDLARFRRYFSGPRQEAEAFAIVFAHDPPPREERVWVLLGALFAAHRHPYRRPASGSRRPTLGSSMQQLKNKRGDSIDRRFVQLVSVDGAALPYYLHQAVQLLRADRIQVDYWRLFDDLLKLLSEDADDDTAQSVRLAWSRDYSRPAGNS
jgi:CRISPR system Cascade subunit CasB